MMYSSVTSLLSSLLRYYINYQPGKRQGGAHISCSFHVSIGKLCLELQPRSLQKRRDQHPT